MTTLIQTPVKPEVVAALKPGEAVQITGRILCGRDAVLPRIAAMIEGGSLADLGVDLGGAVIFHTAVSPAGIGPTTSNKVEIEESIPALSRAGVRLHIGKGALSQKTIEALHRFGSAFAVTPPTSALFSERTKSTRVVAFAEEGMEALYEIVVERFPAIIAVVNGISVFRRQQEKLQ